VNAYFELFMKTGNPIFYTLAKKEEENASAKPPAEG
jgi:hypothetical protein